MRRLLALILLSLVTLSSPSLAQRDRLNASWISSSGAFIVVGPTDANDQFVMNVYASTTSNQLVAQYKASWFDGPNFTYQAGGEQIVGTYMETTDKVELQNRSGSWKSTWRRDS